MTVDTTRRLTSVDVLRGITVAGMILVNNGHGGSFEMLRHARWNGMTLCDLVFPFFLFIMGVSVFLSLTARGRKLDGPVFMKIAKRALLLFAIGLLINWLDKAIDGDVMCFQTLRFWAVLQRIALCYFIVAIMAVSLPQRFALPATSGLVVVYGLLLLLGQGFEYDPTVNVLARVDQSIFGNEHLYHKSPVDPEGLVGTLGSLINVLLGYQCGALLRPREGKYALLSSGFYVSIVLIMLGVIASFVLPLNKRVWSPSFALLTSGICQLALVLLQMYDDMVAGDGRGRFYKEYVSKFFMVFGMNPLFLYIFSEVLAIVASHFGWSDDWFDILWGVIPIVQLASLAYAFSFVAVCFIVGYPLWKRKVYIKL